MKVPLNWLKEYIETGLTAHELANILTMKGLEVDSVYDYEGEKVIEIELTPNRGDCASILGIARELSANTSKEFKKPDSSYVYESRTDDEKYSVSNEAVSLCPVYYLKHIRDVSVSESPEWLKNRLSACGVRPLNNIVDITNYVMLELGQPLHAFDAAKISGGRVVIRKAVDGEKLQTLDNEEKKLCSDDLVIADSSKPIALAGIMGGEETSISETTQDVLLEAAYFVPETVSFSERRHDIRSESSYRFSRNVDRLSVKYAIDRAIRLITEIAGGKADDKYMSTLVESAPVVLKIEIADIKRLLGCVIGSELVMNYLLRLGFTVEEKAANSLSVKVPSFRNDISRPVDIIEEIARVHGYSKISSKLPVSELGSDMTYRDDMKKPGSIMRALGYYEAITHTLVSSAMTEGLFSSDELVSLDNPINVNMDILRPTILFGLLESVQYNLNQGREDVKLYETGPVFFKRSEDSYSEKGQLAFIRAGGGFFDIKKDLMSLLENMDQNVELNYEAAPNPVFDGRFSGEILLNGEHAGYFGMIKKEFLRRYRLKKQDIMAAYIYKEQLDFEKIYKKKFRAWSPYPLVSRDISLLVADDLTHKIINDTIKKSAGDLLKEIKLFDIYKDNKLGKDKKSMTFTLEFSSDSHTLKSEEVEEVIQTVTEKLETEFGITLRPDEL